ncbi:MAG: Xanthine dehydrogenase molybdenum-binding subunit [Planctomycetota bacterium]
MNGEVELRIGFGSHAEKRKVTVAEGDAPSWDLDTKFAVVGSDADRIDGLAKATGRAKYTWDVQLPGMQRALVLRSPVARGKLVRLQFEAARAMPGVSAVVRLKDDGARVRFVGDEIAAVAAATLEQARDALDAMVAEYEAEAHNVEYLEHPEAPVRDDTGHVTDPWPAHEGIDDAMAGAAVVHDATYRTEVQTHSSLESHGAVARWDGNDLTVWCSTQATFGVRNELGQAMKARGYEVGNVTVIAEYVGGGFGSKFTSGREGYAVCALAREANAPVKLMLDRFEEHTCTGNRPAALMQVRGGLAADGTLIAWDWRSFGGTGFNGSGGGVTFPQHYLDNAQRRSSHKDLPADTDPARAMRAPGWPQGYFAGELFLDELAVKAGLDPLEVRRRNDPQVIRSEQWQQGAERFRWKDSRNPQPGSPMQGDDPRWLRGVGCASARWGGMGSPGRPAHGITCRIHQDGTVETRSGAQDIGTGLKTVMALLTAEELGIPVERVRVAVGDTRDPSGPAAGGSTVTPSLSPAVRHAAWLAKQQLAGLLVKRLGVPANEIVFANGKVGAGDRQISFDDACKAIGPNPVEARGQRFPNHGTAFNQGVCGCQFAEVLVDSWTGIVRVTRMLAIQDCGLVIARKLAESQVLGAMIQGMGYALHEQRILDRRSGRVLNGDFLRYKVPGAADMPEMEAVMVTVANGHTNTGAAGVGEPPSVAAPAAIANAVFNATGVALRHLPITPDKVLAALAQRRGS